MKLQKLFALIMAMIMLLGMVPAGHAEVIDCNHNWDWRWPNGQPANCQDWKWCEEYCTICGTGNGGYEQCGDCQPGSWVWDGDPPANCQERGIQNVTCRYCGEVFDEREVYGDHVWGSWYTVKQGTCTEPGREARDCAYCGATEYRTSQQGSHEWGEWQVVEQGTCVKEGREERTCSVCGKAESRATRFGEHKWGEWQVVEQGTCVKEGREERTCSVCGKTESRSTGGGGHKYGEYEIVKSPKCTEKGRREHYCEYCGRMEWASIPETGHDMGNWYVFEEPQVGLPGIERRDCLNECGYFETREIPALEQDFDNVVINPGDVNLDPDGNVSIYDPDGSENADNNGNTNDAQPGDDEYLVVTPGQPGEQESAGGLGLTLVLSSTPANGTHFVVGEQVTFTAHWSNGTDKPLSPFSVSIFTCDTPSFGSAVDQISSWFAEDAGGPVAPGASGSHTLTVTVTEADVARGAIYAMAELLSTVQGGADLENVYTSFVTAPCGPNAGLSAALSVTKEVTSTPANGSYYVPGETVTYEVCVKNNGEPLDMLCVSDWMWDSTFKYGTIMTGEDVTYPISYTVTELDAISGSVSNIAFAEAVAANGDPVMEYSNDVTVPCGFPEGDDPYGVFHSLAVVKAETSTPKNGEYYTEGEVIHYSITYTNDGELPLIDVQVWDTLDISDTIGYAEMLQPGESRTCTYQHTVTAEDVVIGSVLNLAQANYCVSGVEGSIGVNSNLVISKTSADGDSLVVLPIFPTPGTDTKYDPGTGWVDLIPTVPGGVVPPFGTIDTDKLHDGDDYCVRTITGRDNVSVSYETDFCSVHTLIQSTALMMAQAAANPETQTQAAAYAVTLWRAEVEKLYQEICEAADPTAKMVVMTEYTRFLTELANYEAMLKLLYPDQPALAARKVADMWENKCVDLCYDAHASAAERKDSLLAVTPTAGSSAAECTCVTTSETNGQKTNVQSYCPAHSFPFSMIDALLQGKDTAEAWTMVRQIWGVELTSAYNKVFAAMGDNKLLAMAEYNALTQWMMAREATLMALYPDNPEIVVQLMLKTIMERVNDLCQMVN